METRPQPQSAFARLHESLCSILGPDRCLTDRLDFYSSDIFGGDHTAALVIRPGSTDVLAVAAREVTAAGYSIIARGGGTSYTGGHVPDRGDSVIVDTSDLDRIVEVNRDDMYVVVESGVTWKQLHEALRDTDVRTPFWGPLSGGVATVGGSCSQNAILWGSTGHDVSSASVLGVEVVLADGTVLTTGSAAAGAKPFFRPYGPDLTGLFLGDSGALGIKTRLTLRLIRRPAETGFLSYNFDERAKISRALADITREGVASSCFGMDPVLQYQRIKRASLLQGVKALKGVVSTARNTFTGIKDAMRIAVAGKRFIDENGYSLHVVVDGADRAEVRRKLQQVRQICEREGSKIANSLPAMLYGDPFVPMSSAVGPEGERWAPMHGLFAISDADRAWARIEDLLDEFSPRFDEHGIIVGFLVAAASPTAIAVEPVFYWPGPRTAWAEGAIPPADLDKYRDFPDDPDVNAAVRDVRKALNALFDELGAAHLQIGKKYHFAQQLEAPAAQLLEAIKTAVDPQRLMNPKSLGLE
ncbi:MAG: FAD-binding oxidoreductase [Woeseiaceae bacterium]|nr:FAD-binding oxidoreductase [Woeseiaceae bacterium]